MIAKTGADDSIIQSKKVVLCAVLPLCVNCELLGSYSLTFLTAITLAWFGWSG